LRLIGKEKKTPDLPFSLPQCLRPAAVLYVAVKSLTMRLYDAHFKKGHQLAVIGTGGGRRTNKSAQLSAAACGLKQSVRASFCHAVKPQKLTGIGNREGHEDDRCDFMNLVHEHHVGEVSFHQRVEHKVHARSSRGDKRSKRNQQRELGANGNSIGARAEVFIITLLLVDPDLSLRFGLSNELRAGNAQHHPPEAPEFIHRGVGY